MKTSVDTFSDVKQQIAKRLSDYRIRQGAGTAGTLTVSAMRGITRTFRAHWTGYKLAYPGDTVVLVAETSGGDFYTEGYISMDQACWILSFRLTPHPVRGTGAERPDDKFASPQQIETAHEHRRRHLEAGVIPDEEIIRYEDFDDPLEAVDAFFNYHSFYCLKAIGTSWEDFGYSIDSSLDWDATESSIASLPIDSAIDEGLKKSDIIWITVDTDPRSRPIPCWYVYTKEKRLFVLSGEIQQEIPNARRVRDAHVVTRWKGRDARMAEFDAHVRAITPESEEFKQIGELLVAKRQSVTGTAEQNIEKWARQGGVILELTPRA